MKRTVSLVLILLCLASLVSCDINIAKQSQNNAQPAYFVGEVIEAYEKGCLVEVTDEGNYGALAIGTPVHVSTDIENCPEYKVGDFIKVVFDGTVAESYPPQVMHVGYIKITDRAGNNI